MFEAYLNQYNVLTSDGLEQAIRDGMSPAEAMRNAIRHYDPQGGTAGEGNMTFGHGSGLDGHREEIRPDLVARTIASIMAGRGGSWNGGVNLEYERALLLQSGATTVEEILAPTRERWIASANDAVGETHGGGMSPRQERLFAEKVAELEALADHDLCSTVGCLNASRPLGISIKRAGEDEFTPTGGSTTLTNPPPEEKASTASSSPSSAEPAAGPENPQGLTDRQTQQVSSSTASTSAATVSGALAGIDQRVLIALAIAAALAGWLYWRSR